MSMSIIVDLVTLLLASYTLWGYLSLVSHRGFKAEYVIPSIASGLYLIAQTGWTAAFLSGNFWGAVFNNYIWFLFNTCVFVFLILKMRAAQNEPEGEDNQEANE